MTLSKLKEIIKEKYLHEGTFTLSSGAKSTKYFDIKAMMGDYDGMCLLLNELYMKLPPWKSYASFGAIELGGIPLASAFWMSDQMYEYSVCYIRKQSLPRNHGMKKMIEGQPRTPILLVDDVISSGQTIADAGWTCINEGWGPPCGVLCVIDRMTEQDRDTIPVKPIHSLFKESDFE